MIELCVIYLTSIVLSIVILIMNKDIEVNREYKEKLYLICENQKCKLSQYLFYSYSKLNYNYTIYLRII